MNAAYGICGLKPIDTDIKYVQDGDKYANFVNNHFNRIKWFTRMCWIYVYGIGVCVCVCVR